ncbi:MAG: Gfo/Idh/MocA family oxidoreductase [Anaerolineae bacterium]|jgi:predicted dehydrogenase|nr:Gfo/Idh/MocA family oxidoreductase [Anaerolineae bacterium]
MKIGILSLAHLHAEAYIDNVRAVPGVELMGLADEDPARAEHFARQSGTPHFASYAHLLAARPDAVLVCSENARHRPLVEQAAAAGVHVLCEKPLATRVEDARAMVAACQQAGVTLMTAFPMRFSTPLLEIKKLLDAGHLGQVYACNSTNQGECPAHLRAWFVDPELAGGGALTDHIVHLADVLRWYLHSEVTEVYATANRILYGAEVTVETGGLVLLTFASGAIASIDCSWSKPPYYPTWGGLKLDLITEKGLVTVDAFKQVLTVYRQQQQRPAWAYWGSDANQAMIDEFVAAIRAQRPPAVTGEDGLRAVEIVAAAYRSVHSGQPEKL